MDSKQYADLMAMWAKTPKAAEDAISASHYHTVLGHLLDVAAVADAVLELEPETTRLAYAQDWYGSYALWIEVKPWLLAIIALHDIGKVSPAFQKMWPIGKARVEKRGFKCETLAAYTAHGPIGQCILKQYLPKFFQDVDPIGSDSRTKISLIASAVACHHGFRFSNKDTSDISSSIGSKNTPWPELQRDTVAFVLDLFDCIQAPTLTEVSAAAFQRLAGLTSFADWIASNSQHFPMQSHIDIDDIGKYYHSRLTIARKVLEDMGWQERIPLRDQVSSFAELFPFAPRPLQSAIETLTQNVDAPCLLLIEAPMGEGKTEAAFLAHVNLQSQLQHRGLYVALPTQATSNAMYQRTKTFLASLQVNQTIDLQLLHSNAHLQQKTTSDLYLDPQNLQLNPKDAKEKQERVHTAEWFTSKKRGLLSEYGVGTVDQALLGLLNVKHQFVRLWGLGNRTVVIDEVHAYDTYTSALIVNLVEWLHALGSSVIIMSATLPEATRIKILHAYGAPKAALPTASYPRVYRVSQNQATVEHFAADPSRDKQLQLKAHSDTTHDIAQTLLTQSELGGCVVYIANTVQRAQEVYSLLRAQRDAAELRLFHARFPIWQRQALEQDIVSLFAQGSRCRPDRMIVVATQVIEQSLDLDFDLMISDLAPMDLLLQRAGRLHRHQRSVLVRGAHTKPTLYIAGLTDEALPSPDLLASASHKSAMYDAYILCKTYLFCQHNPSICLPADIDRAVEEVYSVPVSKLPYAPTPEVQEKVQAYDKQSQEQKKEHETNARAVLIGSPNQTGWINTNKVARSDDENSWGDLKAVTRLGEPSLQIVLMNKRADGSVWVGDTQVSLSQPPSPEEARSYLEYALPISHQGVVTSYLQPKAETTMHADVAILRALWEKSPFLRYSYPLILEDGVASVGKTVLKYLAEQHLGVEISRQS